jgi:hypothetical protein
VRVTDPEELVGTLLNVGADGCALSLPSAPGDRLRMRVSTGAIVATLDLEVRWQRRAWRARWEMGGLIVGVELAEAGGQEA